MQQFKIVPGGAEKSSPRRRASDRAHLSSLPTKPKGPSDVPRLMVHYWASQLDNAEHCRRAHSEAAGAFVLRAVGALVVIAILAVAVLKI